MEDMLKALPPPAAAEVPDDLPWHVRDHLQVLARHRRAVAWCFGGTVALALVASLVIPRRYSAATRVEVARRSPIQLRLDGIVHRAEEGDGSTSATTMFLTTQIEALQSRDLAERVIAQRHLAEYPGFVTPRGTDRAPLLDAGGLLGSLSPRGWEVPSAPVTDAEKARTAAQPPVDPLLLDRYMRYLSVRDVRGTDLIEVRFTTPSPALSAFLAAAHTQAYIETNEKARQATDEVADEFLGRQLSAARAQMERAETALEQFGSEHPQIAADQGHKAIGERTAELSRLLTQVEAERTTLESRYDFLSGPDGNASAYFLEIPGVQKLRLARLDVFAARAALGSRLGPNHPQMRKLAELNDELGKQMESEVGEGVAAARAQSDAASLREARLRRKLAQQEEAAVGLRALDARYTLLQGDVEAAGSLHASLLKQRAETAVNSDLSATNVRVIERAEIPQHPSRPNVPLILALGVLGGTVLAVGVAFGSEYFDRSVKSSLEVEGLLQMPTLAAIPNFSLARPAVPRLPLMIGQATDGAAVSSRHFEEVPVLMEPWSRAAEAFRSARTAVLFANPAAPPRVVLVTSARMGEGKTVASVNLAMALAESGARVLLIDADLRHPRCHATLGVGNERGLSSVLGGGVALDDALQVLEGPRLVLLSAGPAPANPAELLGSPRLRDLLTTVRARFDFIVLDTSPVLPVTDAVLLARVVDGVVLVVKGHDTPREVLRRARDRLVLAGAPFLGVVVNNVGPGWGDPDFQEPYDRYYGGPPVGQQHA